jgi:integrase/recombinase XerD
MKKNTKRARVIYGEDYRRLFKISGTTKHPLRDQLIIQFSFGLGLRSKELAGLCIGDIIDENNRVIEDVTLTKTKGDKIRTAYITDQALKIAILKYIGHYKEHCEKLKLEFHPRRPLFYSQKLGGFTAQTMVKRLKVLYRLAGIEGASSHSGRRTFISKIAETTGGNAPVIKFLAGHENIKTTWIYIETNPFVAKKAVQHANLLRTISAGN